MSSDSDIDETHRILCTLSNNWATYVLTIKTREDINLLKGKKFLTNIKSTPGKWVFREFTDNQLSMITANMFNEWLDTQVIFVGDLAESAGFEMNIIK